MKILEKEETMNTMNFTEFQNWAVREIRPVLSDDYRDATIRLQRLQKLGKSYEAMMVKKKEETVVPVINLNHYYESYKNGMPREKILSEMKHIAEDRKRDFDLSWIDDYEKIRARLFVRVNNLSRMNRIPVPFTRIEDLSLTYHAMVDTGESGLSSFTITTKMMERLHLTKEELHEDAIENSRRILPVKISNIFDVLERIVPREFDNTENCREMWIVSNTQEINGAAALFYPGVMEEISSFFAGSYYVIPSSIHEMIVLKDENSISRAKLRETVRSVNRLVVKEEDWLSDHIYRYDADDKRLHICFKQ